MGQIKAIQDQYESLSESEKLVMHILSCFHLPVTVEDIVSIARRMTLKNEVRAEVAQKEAALILLKSLYSRQLIHLARSNVAQCIPEKQEYLFGRMVLDASQSAEIFPLVESIIKKNAKWMYCDSGIYITLFKFRQALHLRQRDFIQSLFAAIFTIEQKHDYRQIRYTFGFSAIQRVFGTPFSRELLEILPRIQEKKYVLYQLFDVFRQEKGRICPAMKEAMLEYCDCQVFFQYLLFAGDFAAIEILIVKNPCTPLFYMGKAFLAVAKGDFAAARAPFDMAYNLLCREKKRNDDQFFIAFYQTYLIAMNDEEQFKLVAAGYGSDSKFNSPSRISVFKQLYSQGSCDYQRMMALCKIFVQDSIGEAMLKLLWTYWFDLSPDNFKSSVQAFEIVLEQRDKAKNYAFVRSLWNKQSTPNEAHPLFALLPKVERWQTVLDELILAYKNAGNTEETEKTERLIWRIQQENRTVGAVVQKRGKNGKWSQGRQVNFSDFPTDSEYMHDYVTPADLEAILCVKRRNDDYYRRGVELSVELLQLLTRVPYVQYSDSAFFLKIVFAQPVLSCAQSNNSLRIGLIPPFGINEKFVCVYDNKELLTVYPLPEKLAKLAKYLNGSLTVPADRGLHKVEQLISVITPHVELEGDIAAFMKDLPRVDGEQAVAVRIYPFESGLRFEIVALPYDGFAFTPGKGNADFVVRLPDGNVVVCRNLEQENKNANAVIDAVTAFNHVPADNCCWRMDDPFDALEVLADLKANVHIKLEWPQGETLTLKAEVDADKVFQTINAGKNEWFSVSGELKLDETKVLTMRELLELWGGKKQRFIPLSDKTYIALSQKLQKALEDVSAVEQGDSHDGGLRVHKLSLPLLQEHFQARSFDGKTVAWLESYQRTLTQTMPVPAGFTAQLRDYQHDGVQWLMRLAAAKLGALLADDMGLGKTVQAIALLQQQRKNGAALIVAPASVCFNWADEIARFAPVLKTVVVGIQSVNREEIIGLAGENDIVITSYGLLLRNSELFCSKAWNVLILDEAQAVKNSAAQRTKAIKQLNRNFTVITTGTPIENHLGELWNLFDIILPGFLGGATHFRSQFQLPIERDEDRTVRNRLRRLISPFILRRTKDEVLSELPPKTEIELKVALSDEESSFYEALRRKAVENIESSANSENDSRFTILAELMKLRQACCHPSLAGGVFLKHSSKMEVLGEKIAELIENGHRALVFSQFVGHLTLVQKYLDELGISCFYLDGSTPQKKRAEMVRAFQDGERSLFLISLKAGGSGLNLTGADFVFHLDPWWNPAVEDQASDRVHRIGQERPVTVYRLIASNTIEDKIIGLHKQKRELAESLLSGGDTALRLSADELFAIIKDR